MSRVSSTTSGGAGVGPRQLHPSRLHLVQRRINEAAEPSRVDVHRRVTAGLATREVVRAPHLVVGLGLGLVLGLGLGLG